MVGPVDKGRLLNFRVHAAAGPILCMVMMVGIWNRIISPVIPGVTASDAFKAQPAAFQRAVGVDGV